MTAEQLQAVAAILLALTSLVSAFGVIANLFLTQRAQAGIRLVETKVDGNTATTNALLAQSLAGNIAAAGVTPDQLSTLTPATHGDPQQGAQHG